MFKYVPAASYFYMKALDVGCGNLKVPGAIGVDFHKVEGVDVVHNLNKFPYPFKNQEFDVIYANHVLEHLDAPLDRIIKELLRILKPNGVIKIEVPHALSVGAFADPTHKKFFTIFTFDYFGNNIQSYYNPDVKVKIKKRKFVFKTGRISGFVLKPVEFLINLNPVFYSHFFAFIFPCSTLYFEIQHPDPQKK